MYMKSFTNISYFGVNTSELVMEKVTYHDNQVFYSHKRSPLYLITRSATVAAMAESVSTWSMRTPKTDSVGRVIYGTVCIPTQNQTVNRLTINVVSYLVGPTPFPRVAPLPVPHSLPPPCHNGSSICLSKTHQSHPSPIPSLPPPLLVSHFMTLLFAIIYFNFEQSVNSPKK